MADPHRYGEAWGFHSTALPNRHLQRYPAAGQHSSSSEQLFLQSEFDSENQVQGDDYQPFDSSQPPAFQPPAAPSRHGPVAQGGDYFPSDGQHFRPPDQRSFVQPYNDQSNPRNRFNQSYQPVPPQSTGYDGDLRADWALSNIGRRVQGQQTFVQPFQDRTFGPHAHTATTHANENVHQQAPFYPSFVPPMMQPQPLNMAAYPTMQMVPPPVYQQAPPTGQTYALLIPNTSLPGQTPVFQLVTQSSGAGPISFALAPTTAPNFPVLQQAPTQQQATASASMQQAPQQQKAPAQLTVPRPEAKGPERPSDAALEKNALSPKIVQVSATTPQLAGEILMDLETCPLYTGDEDDEAFHWADGYVRRKFVLGTEPADYSHTKWVFRNRGRRKHEGDPEALMAECLGVFICSNSTCAIPARPKTSDAARSQQLREGCGRCGGTSYNVTTPKCPAKYYTFTYHAIDGSYRVFDHEGFHNHPKVPENGYMSGRQSSRIIKAVERNPTTNALRMRTKGGDAPGSRPLTEISPALHDQRKVRYQQSKAKAALGITTTSSEGIRGGFLFLTKLNGLNGILGERFCVDSQWHNLCYFQLQTAFMMEAVRRTVDDWMDEDPRKNARHGFITDGNHSFFKDGVLLTSASFDLSVLAFIPVLYTWTLRTDTEHHIPHFRRLNSAVMGRLKELKTEFEPKFLLHVMDFSVAQRAAHGQAYAEAVIPLKISGYASLTKEAQVLELQVLEREAEEAQEGCSVHWWRSVQRLNKLLTDEEPVSQQSVFRVITSELMSDSQERFIKAVERIKSQFPQFLSWISWWLKPSIAQMTFPSQRRADPVTIAQTPNTSNAVEHLHQLLGHAAGSRHDILKGIEELFSVASAAASASSASKDGSYNPAGPRKPRPLLKGVKIFENDGRAPDTYKTLSPKKKRTAKNAGSAMVKSGEKKSEVVKGKRSESEKLFPSPSSPTKGSQKPPVAKGTPSTKNKTVKFKRKAASLISYKWSRNSCWIDASLEVWFRVFERWPEEWRRHAHFLGGGKTFVKELFRHFQTRIRITSSPKPDVKKLKAELQQFREVTRSKLLNDWKADDPRTNGMGDAAAWLQVALKDGTDPENDRSVIGLFCMRFEAFCQCSERHSSDYVIEKNGVSSLMVQRLSPIFTHRLGLHLGHGPTLTQYFEHFIPQTGTDTLHDRLNSVPCSEDGCGLMADPNTITIICPRSLFIMSDCRLDSRPSDGAGTHTYRAKFEREFHIGDGECRVTYQLVARVVYQPLESSFEGSLAGEGAVQSGHYVVQAILDDGDVYDYDDCASDGKLTPAQRPTAVDEAHHNVLYYAYARVTEQNLICRRIEDIATDVAMLQPFEEPLDIPDSPTPTAKPRKSTAKPLMSTFPPPAPPPLPKVTDGGQLMSSCSSECVLRESELKAEPIIQCSLCKGHRHIQCMTPKYLSPLYKPEVDEDEYWCCPECTRTPGGLWEQKIIGRFILIDINSKLYGRNSKVAHYLPAEVIKHNGDTVTLQWHKHNYFPFGPTMFRKTFNVTVEECILALTRDTFLYNARSLGSIEWPLELSSKALDMGYRNSALVETLRDSRGRILNIVDRLVPHPLIVLLDRLVQRSKTPRLPERDLHEFSKSFHIPILPADAEIVDQYVEKTWAEFKDKANKAEDKYPLPLEQAEVCIRILFLVVSARHYLGCSPLHDGEVFDLAWIPSAEHLGLMSDASEAVRGRLEAVLSIHERAFNSCLPVIPNAAMYSSNPPSDDDLDTRPIPLEEYMKPDNRAKVLAFTPGDRLYLNQHISRQLPAVDYRERIRALKANNEGYCFTDPPSTALTLSLKHSTTPRPLPVKPLASITSTFRIISGRSDHETGNTDHGSRGNAELNPAVPEQKGKQGTRVRAEPTRRSTRIATTSATGSIPLASTVLPDTAGRTRNGSKDQTATQVLGKRQGREGESGQMMKRNKAE